MLAHQPTQLPSSPSTMCAAGLHTLCVRDNQILQVWIANVSAAQSLPTSMPQNHYAMQLPRLAEYTSLCCLDVSYNKLSDVKSLSCLATTTEELYLSSNKISNIEVCLVQPALCSQPACEPGASSTCHVHAGDFTSDLPNNAGTRSKSPSAAGDSAGLDHAAGAVAGRQPHLCSGMGGIVRPAMTCVAMMHSACDGLCCSLCLPQCLKPLKHFAYCTCPCDCKCAIRHVDLVMPTRPETWASAACRLQQLRKLSLQSNHLTSVDELAACTMLEELWLSHNGITSIQVCPPHAGSGEHSSSMSDKSQKQVAACRI